MNTLVWLINNIVIDWAILNEAGNWIFGGILKFDVVYLILNTFYN